MACRSGKLQALWGCPHKFLNVCTGTIIPIGKGELLRSNLCRAQQRRGKVVGGEGLEPPTFSV